MATFKLKRLASEISRHVSTILLVEARDELLKTITITGCEVTNDLSYATLYFTSILEMDSKLLEKEVNEASHFIRGRLSELLDVRHTPNLRFVFDKSIEYGNNIEKKLMEIKEKQGIE